MPGFLPESTAPVGGEGGLGSPTSTKVRVFSLGNLGCNNGCSCKSESCSCYGTVCVVDCSGTPIVGASVTVGTLAAVPTVSPTGCTGLICLDSLGGAGTYQVVVTKSGYITYNQSKTFTCSGGPTITMLATGHAGYTWSCVGCNAPPISATITIAGGTYSLGQTIYLTGAGTYPYTINSINPATYQPYTGSLVISGTCSAGGSIPVANLTPISGYYCCTDSVNPALNVYYPLPATLNYTDSIYGSTTLTWQSANYWLGTMSASYGGGCAGCPHAETTTVTIKFQLCQLSLTILVASGPPIGFSCPAPTGGISPQNPGGCGVATITQNPYSYTFTCVGCSATFSTGLWPSSVTFTITP